MPQVDQPPTSEPIDLHVALSLHFQRIEQGFKNIQQLNNPSQEIINLHNLCHELMQVCGIIIGVTIFPELTKKDADDEKSPIIKS